MRINNNLMAMNTHRQLGINSANGAKSIEKLSSGYRINRAGDDAAGLAISEKMRAQIRGLNQASRNSQDAISLVQTAEGALGETQSILQRMRELSVQSANDTNVNSDRTEIQNEMDQLTSEINRIGNTTEFNTNKLLNGGSGKTGNIAYEIDTAGVAGVAVTGDLSATTQLTASVAAGTGAVSAVTSNASTAGAAAVGTISPPVQTTASIVAGTGETQLFRTETSSVAAANTGDVEASFNVDTASSAAGTYAANRSQTNTGDGGANFDTFALEITTNFTDGDSVELFGDTFTAGTDFVTGATITESRDNLLAAIDALTGGAGQYISSTNGATQTYALSDNDTSFGGGGYSDDNLIVFTNVVNVTNAADINDFNVADVDTAAGPTAGVSSFEVTAQYEVGQTITIGDLTLTATTAASVAGDGNFTIGADLDATAVNLLKAMDEADGNVADGVVEAGSITVGTAYNIAAVGVGVYSDTIQLTETVASGTDIAAPVTGDVAAVAGVSSFEVKTQYTEGDVISIGGEDFTATTGGNTGNAFTIGADVAATAANIVAAIELNATIKDDYAAVQAAGSDGNNKIELTETGTGIDGVDLVNPVTTQVTEQAGVSDFTVLTDLAVGETITIDGEVLTAVATGGAGNTASTFEVGTDETTTAANMKAAFDLNATLSAHYTVGAAAGKVTLTEKVGQADGSAAPTGPTVAGVGEVRGDYEFEVTTNPSVGDKITIDGVELTGVASGAVANDGTFNIGADLSTTADNLVTAATGDAVLSAHFDAIKVTDNTDPLAPEYSIKLTEKAGQADGDATIAVSATNVTEVKGVYTIDVDTNFASGDKVEIDGVTLTAGAANTATTFAVGVDADATSVNLKASIDLSTLSTRFATTQSGNSISLTEKVGQATGVALANATETGAATQGEFTFSTQSLDAGASITIDGEVLTMVTGGDDSATAAELKTLVEGNATLNASYDVAVTDAEVTLTQKTGQESTDKPVVTYETTAGSGFNATMQIGANTGQSLSVDMNDMRADALNISSGDGTATTVDVEGKEYQVAWSASKSITSGVDNIKSEYSLDVSTADNATAAVQVINNAINAVSSERSKLGAFQNRLEHTIKNLDTSAENLQASESRIRDVDMAKEMMEFTKNNILSQAAQSMLAQANQAPQGVLQLLR